MESAKNTAFTPMIYLIEELLRMRYLLIPGILLAVAAPVKAELPLEQALDTSAMHFTANWMNTPELMQQRMQPQVVIKNKYYPVWGGCSDDGKQIKNHTTGSNWCGPTNTITLLVEDLIDLYRSNGDGSVFYIVAHEFAHAHQWLLEETSD